MRLQDIISEEITIGDLEKIVRKVYIDAIKKQVKKMRSDDDQTHHMFFVAVKGKTLADKIRNDTVKSLNKTVKRKPDVLKRMNASKAEKEIRNNISLITTNYILASKKKR